MKQIFVTLFFTLTLSASCSKIEPAGFWTEFEKKYILNNISDQGPYGGHRAMFWKNKNKGFFNTSKLIDFASTNNWKLVDSIILTASVINNLTGNKSTFPFTYTDFSSTKAMHSEFPKWIQSDITLYRFETGWIAVEPGNARETQNNGYIVLNQNRTELSVYHLWGE